VKKKQVAELGGNNKKGAEWAYKKTSILVVVDMKKNTRGLDKNKKGGGTKDRYYFARQGPNVRDQKGTKGKAKGSMRDLGWGETEKRRSRKTKEVRTVHPRGLREGTTTGRTKGGIDQKGGRRSVVVI